MAMDFPASPTAGQLFTSPTNGVVYQYSTTYTAWLPLSVTGAGQGDFFASTAAAITSTTSTIVFPTVISGNAGGWYSTSTGRFTPPAGRYLIFAQLAGASTAASNITVALRKNGTSVVGVNTTTAASGFQGVSPLSYTADANGTDFFDIQGTCNPTSNVSVTSWFGAFPLIGAAQPAGTGSAWRQIGRVVPTAGLASISFQNLPSDINDLELFFDVTPATNAQDLVLQFYDNTGTIDATTAHYAFATTMSNNAQSVGSAPAVYNSFTAGYTAGLILNASATANHVGNVSGIRGRVTIPNIRDARLKGADWQNNYIDDTAANVRMITGGGWRNVSGLISGVRLLFLASNFAAGGAVSLWGSP